MFSYQIPLLRIALHYFLSS